jgi:ribonuclease-3 family protein
MEESVDAKIHENGSFTDAILEGLDLKNPNPRQLSPLVLAYIGDSVYDLIIKTYLIDAKGNMQVNKLNRMASGLVKAHAQSEIIGIIEDRLSDEEEAVYKRGRNAKSYTSAKNATITDYRRATGFEALIGYLYLNKEFERMVELVKLGLSGFLGEVQL